MPEKEGFYVCYVLAGEVRYMNIMEGFERDKRQAHLTPNDHYTEPGWGGAFEPTGFKLFKKTNSGNIITFEKATAKKIAYMLSFMRSNHPTKKWLADVFYTHDLPDSSKEICKVAVMIAK